MIHNYHTAPSSVSVGSHMTNNHVNVLVYYLVKVSLSPSFSYLNDTHTKTIQTETDRFWYDKNCPRKKYGNLVYAIQFS